MRAALARLVPWFLVSAETREQDTRCEANQSAGVKVLPEGRNLEAERLVLAAIARAEQF